MLRDAPLEQVEMLWQDDARLHHVQIVDLGRVDRAAARGEEIRLLLVVALEANPVAGADDRLKKRCRALRPHHLAIGVAGTGLQASVSFAPLLLPLCHIVIPQSYGREVAAGGPLDIFYEQDGGSLGIWRKWAENVQGQAMKGGHFFPEENPTETTEILNEFLSA